MHIETLVHDHANDAFDTHRSKTAVWTGRVLSTLAILFLTLDGVAKLLLVQPVIAGSQELGYPPSTVLPMGVILLLCVMAYAIPRTSVMGALLLTGYLGGAVATHFRVGNPLFTHTLFPIYFACFIWGGLLLRDARLRVLLPGARR